MPRTTFKITRNGNSLTLVVPRHALKALNWRLGTEVCIDIIDGRLVVTELEMRVRERIEARVAPALHSNRLQF